MKVRGVGTAEVIVVQGGADEAHMNTRHDEQYWEEMAAEAEAGGFRPVPGGKHLTGEAAAAAGRAIIQQGYGTTDPDELHQIITGHPSLSVRPAGVSGRSPKRQVRARADR